MKYLFLIQFFLLSSLLISQATVTETYIKKYKTIAIAEMERTGIPASITLAQGMLESNWGRSTLATKSNNHFGIKCNGGWEGKSHYRFDDEYSKLGTKKKSCFRVYASAEESFYDHSQFLTDEKKVKRYGFLFYYPSEDYTSWAKGLSKSGYASDPKYASKLINIIEKHQLWQYDQKEAVQLLAIAKKPAKKEYKITYINSCKVVLANGGESAKQLARELGITSRNLLKNNPEIEKRSQILAANQRIFLEDKKNYYLGKKYIHFMEDHQNMNDVANQYGIDKEYLISINRITDLNSLQSGSEIALKRGKKTVKRKPEKEKVERVAWSDQSEYLFRDALVPVKP